VSDSAGLAAAIFDHHWHVAGVGSASDELRVRTPGCDPLRNPVSRSSECGGRCIWPQRPFPEATRSTWVRQYRDGGKCIVRSPQSGASHSSVLCQVCRSAWRRLRIHRHGSRCLGARIALGI
jgi:hypothetical protein